MRLVGLAVVIAIIFCLTFGLAAYKFNDCRKVGHTVTYCILDLD